MAELADRDKHERGFARRLAKLSSEKRRELETLLGDPPDLSRVPDSFWRETTAEFENELVAAILLVWIAVAGSHGMATAAATSRGQGYSVARAGQVARDFVRNTRDSLDLTFRAGAGGGTSSGDLQRPAAGVFSTGRIERLVSTETTAAQSAASEAAIADGPGLSDDDLWITSDDQRVCPICGPLHRKRRTTWAAKFPSGSPAHPTCRCFIQYANQRQVARAA